MQGKTVNGYTLQRLLGAGGMAEVWLAENEIGMQAAVKIMSDELAHSPQMRDRFLNEAKVMVKLDHPNIRKVYGYGNIDDRPAIIMEYLDGQDLKALLKRGRRFTEEELRKWWNQLVSALNYTHAQNIVHRDIKSSNIFLDKKGDVKLLDFGIAKVADTTSGTQTGSTLGTRIYMSPEQVKDPKRVGPKSDVYSLAVSFVHLLSGKAPYDSTTSSDFDIQVNIVTKPLDLSHLPESWQGFLMPFLEKDPEKRPWLRPYEATPPVAAPVAAPTANVDDEETVVGGMAPKPKPQQPEKSPSQKKSKKGLWIGLGIAVVAALALLLWLLLRPESGKNNDSKKKKLAEKTETTETTYPLPYQLDTDMKPYEESYVKEKNVLKLWLNKNDHLLFETAGRPPIYDFNPSSLKNEIVKFITPNLDDESAPEVMLERIYLLGDVWVSKAVISFVDDHPVVPGQRDNYEAFSKVANEIAKAYDQVREDLSMEVFGKHLNQLTPEQISAIREAVPVRVVGVGEYLDSFGLEVVENDYETGDNEGYLDINNAFIETCMLYKDDLNGIKKLVDEYYQHTSRYPFNAHIYNDDVYVPMPAEEQLEPDKPKPVSPPKQNVSVEQPVALSTSDEDDGLEEEIEEDEVFIVVEEMPEFPGGMQKLSEYLAQNIKYPQLARESGIQGRVFVYFVVEPDGSVSNIQVLRGIGGGCDEEAIRVVNSMPKWKPGKQRGKPVRVCYNLPVNFQLK